MPDWLELRGYHEALRIAAEEAAQTGDSERLVTLDSLQREFIHKLGSTSRTQLFGSLMIRSTAVTAGRTMEKAWKEIGDASQAKPWKNFTDAIDPNVNPKLLPTPQMIGDRRGSNIVARGMTEVAAYRNPHSSSLTEANLRGGRLAEYAVYERLMIHGMALLLLVALGFLIIAPLRHRREIGPLGSRLAGLLNHRDRLVILFTGVILPAAVYLLSTRLPWLESRDASISAIGFFLWIGQSVAFVVAALLGTLQTTRRRIGRHGNVLSLGWVGPDMGRLGFPIALTIMPLTAVLTLCMQSWPHAMEAVAIVAGCLLAYPLLWLIIQAAGYFIGPEARKLHRSVLMHAARPFVAGTLILPALAIPGVHAEERAWTREVRFESLEETSFFGSRLDREYGDWITEEILRELEAME